MSITVKFYHSSQKSLWDDFVSNSKNGTFLFKRDFMEYHSHKFQDFSLMIFDHKGALRALLPANKVGTIVHSHQGLTYGSLVLKESVTFDTVVDCFRAILEFLDVQGITQLNLKQIPSFYCIQPSSELTYILKKMKAEQERIDILSLIDFTLVPLKKSRDRNAGIKRGAKHQLEVREEKELSSFWNEILIPNLESKYGVTPVHTLDEITYLKNKFPDHIRQFNVYHDNRIVAGTTIFATQQVAHSQYISSNREKNILGSLDYLHAYLIHYYKDKKRYFDFGTSNERNGKINKGLLYWKEGFGARTEIQEFYAVNTANSYLLNDIFK